MKQKETIAQLQKELKHYQEAEHAGAATAKAAADKEISAAVARVRREEQQKAKDALARTAAELNETRRQLTEMDEKFVDISNENKALKLKLEVKQELQMLTQNSTGQYAILADLEADKKVDPIKEATSYAGKQAWNDTAKALFKNASNAADQNAKLLNPTSFD